MAIFSVITLTKDGTVLPKNNDRPWEEASNGRVTVYARKGHGLDRAERHVGEAMKNGDISAIAVIIFPTYVAACGYCDAVRSIVASNEGMSSEPLMERFRAIREVFDGTAMTPEEVFLLGAAYNLREEWNAEE